MADWEMIAKSLSEAGKSAAMGLIDRNRQKLADYYDQQKEERGNRMEQIRFERDRAARMLDEKELMKARNDIDLANWRIKMEDEADLKKWGEDPALHKYADDLLMKADTFGDADARKQYVGLGKVLSSIKAGKLEKELDADEQAALAGLQPDMQSSLKSAIQANQTKRLQNTQAETMIKYYYWLMDPKQKAAEWAKLSWQEKMDLKDKRTEIYGLINAREQDKDFMFGREQAMKAGINPNMDPRSNPNWESLTSGPKAKPEQAQILLSYLDRWKQVAALKNILGEINEGLYEMDPTTDPERYLRDLKSAEDRAKGIFPLPQTDEKRKGMIEMATAGMNAPAPAEKPVWKKFFGDTIGGFFKSTFLDVRENFQHHEEYDDFRKMAGERYGLDKKQVRNIKLLTNPTATVSSLKDDIGTVFYDPHRGILVEIVEDPMRIGEVNLVPLQEVKK